MHNEEPIETPEQRPSAVSNPAIIDVTSCEFYNNGLCQCTCANSKLVPESVKNLTCSDNDLCMFKQLQYRTTELDEANSLIDKLIEQSKYKDNIISSLRQTIDNIVKLLRENSLL